MVRYMLMDELMDALNAALEVADWVQVVELAPTLGEQFLSVGDALQAELVHDLYCIALDALQHPLPDAPMAVSGVQG